MIPPSFEYERPGSRADALSALQRYGADACVLAGGQSLLPRLKTRQSRPGVVVDIGRIEELRGLGREDGELRLGALVTQARVLASPDVRQHFPVFSNDFGTVGDPLVENCATFAGALVCGEPGSDWTACALMLGVSLEVESSAGPRRVSLDHLCSGSASLGAGDLVIAVRIPLRREPERMAYESVRDPASRFALVGVAAFAERDGEGRVTDCRVAVVGARNRPQRASGIEDALRGRRVDAAAIRDIAAARHVELDGRSDIFGGTRYRQMLLRTTLERALRRLT